MDAEGDVARIFHHVGQELAKQRGAHGVDLFVAVPNCECLLEVMADVAVEHPLSWMRTSAPICSTPRSKLGGGRSPCSAITRFPGFFAMSPIRSRSLITRSAPTIWRRSTAIG